MLLTRPEAHLFLEGIQNHARADNFEQVILQANRLLSEMTHAVRTDTEDSSPFRAALPLLRDIIADATRSDSRAALEHTARAQKIIELRPTVTPAWPENQ